MTLDEIFELWGQDSHISKLELDNAALNIPKLHAKYYRILSQERLLLRKLESEADTLYNNKKLWLLNELASDELKALGWEPQLKKHVKSNVDETLKADKDCINMTLKVALQHEKVEALLDIIKSIHNRSFSISNAINFMKFQQGIG
jgi:undecaprenyl pyrophosphate synthase